MFPFALLQDRFSVRRDCHHALLYVRFRGGVVFSGGEVDTVGQCPDRSAVAEEIGDNPDIQAGAAARTVVHRCLRRVVVNLGVPVAVHPEGIAQIDIDGMVGLVVQLQVEMPVEGPRIHVCAVEQTAVGLHDRNFEFGAGHDRRGIHTQDADPVVRLPVRLLFDDKAGFVVVVRADQGVVVVGRGGDSAGGLFTEGLFTGGLFGRGLGRLRSLRRILIRENILFPVFVFHHEYVAEREHIRRAFRIAPFGVFDLALRYLEHLGLDLVAVLLEYHVLSLQAGERDRHHEQHQQFLHFSRVLWMKRAFAIRSTRSLSGSCPPSDRDLCPPPVVRSVPVRPPGVP